MRDELTKRFQALFKNLNIDEVLDAEDQFTPGNGSSVSGRIVGYHLDNAMGDDVSVDAVLKGYQEFVLFVEVYDDAARDVRTGTFNVASLVADIRANSEVLSQESMFKPYLWFLNTITSDCRSDMHEPDEQGVSMTVEQTHEFSFKPSKADDRMRLSFNRETPVDPKLPVVNADFGIETFIRMLLSIPA